VTRAGTAALIDLTVAGITLAALDCGAVTTVKARVLDFGTFATAFLELGGDRFGLRVCGACHEFFGGGGIEFKVGGGERLRVSVRGTCVQCRFRLGGWVG
jgi:NAD-dependent dihydropyrimidine dehydrogenase PreA subunit